MGTFTVTLREAIDLSTPLDQYAAVGLDTYAIFDEEYRVTLNDKIIDHFDEQEIGHETISMFRHAMKRKMNEIMPLMNQHYKASQIAIDPLLTVNIKNVAESTEANTTVSSSTADGRVVSSNTPQVRLSGQGDYATAAQDSKSKTDADGTGSQESTSENTTAGYQGNPAELIYALRQTFVNVDLMIIDSLAELFMMIWDNGEEHTKGSMLNDYFTFYPFR